MRARVPVIHWLCGWDLTQHVVCSVDASALTVSQDSRRVTCRTCLRIRERQRQAAQERADRRRRERLHR